jgi:hypothetical protein
VRDAAHAPYAIAFAEREIDRQPVTGAVLVAAGVLLMLAGVLLGYGWMFAAGGGPIGAGVSSFASPKRMQRSIDANRRLELTRTSVGR